MPGKEEKRQDSDCRNEEGGGRWYFELKEGALLSPFFPVVVYSAGKGKGGGARLKAGNADPSSQRDRGSEEGDSLGGGNRY